MKGRFIYNTNKVFALLLSQVQFHVLGEIGTIVDAYHVGPRSSCDAKATSQEMKEHGSEERIVIELKIIIRIITQIYLYVMSRRYPFNPSLKRHGMNIG